MKVLIIGSGVDNGGVQIAIKQAFDRHAPDWEVRSVTRAQNWIQYDQDILWPPGADGIGEQVAELFAKADVVHVMEKFGAIESFPGWEDKPRIMHHHGSVFRGDPHGFVARCKREGILQLGAIFDIIKLAPGDLMWLPNPVDLRMMLRYRADGFRPHNRIRIAQSPAGRGPNHTNQFLKAMEQVYGAEPLLIEHQPWREHLRRKATADAVFDSFTTGYGITLSEGWGMNLPGIAGCSDSEALTVMERYIGYIPYFPVTEEIVVDRLRMFVEDDEVRDHYADLGWQTVNDFHEESKVVDQLKVIYEQAVG